MTLSLPRAVRAVVDGLSSVRRRRDSIRGKLTVVVLLTTGIALAVAGIGMLSFDLGVYRRSWAADLGTEAGILALSTAPALAFDDNDAAVRSLNALRARPAISAAALYDAHDRLYAQYQQNGEPSAPEQLPVLETPARLSGQRVEVSRLVQENGEKLGTVYLRAHYAIAGRVEAYVGIFGLVTLLSVVAVLALATPVQKSLTEPLEAMANIAQQVVSQSDYSLRAAQTTQDEMGLVVAAFNRMLDEVQMRTLAMEKSNTALRGTEEALRDADRRKDEFLATLAHELRNPLAPIRHAAKVLESPMLSDAQRAWAREVIGRQVHRMALLLDDLLDVSRITRGRLELRKDLVSLTALVNSAVETARPLIEEKRHELRLHLPEDSVPLHVDPLRLSQALSNLLTNAAKYTDSGGIIELTAMLTAAELRFTVTDTGIGLDAAAMPRLFEMFSQVDSAIDRAEGGLGIGLALVKGLIGLHGGTVEASSSGPGRGSTFILHLPRTVVEATRTPDAGPHEAPEPVSEHRRVLVADDNVDAAESLALVLQLDGHQVFVASSGAEALLIGERERPHAVILDIGMPGMTGYETARRIREQPWGRHALLIALTGWGQQDDKDSARSAGFDHHLTKPVPPESVQRLLQDSIANRIAS